MSARLGITGRLARMISIGPSPARGWLRRTIGLPASGKRDRPTVSTSARHRRADWLSLPLATALVAGIAAALLVTEAVDGALPPVDAPVAPGPPMVAMNPALGLASPVPEPAAGPDDAEPPDDGEPLDHAEPSNEPAFAEGRRALPEIPVVPNELDDIARELQRRRAEVLELEAALALREAAVRAAESDLAAQVDRLEAFKRELEALVGEAEAEEEERLQQLVKMYESMRAKSAAAIFDRLELPVILAVAERMREARMAAILAAMDPGRARMVTSELARERELPQLD